jgi:hypothetical protein
MTTDLEKTLLQRIDRLQRGIPFHVHRCPFNEHEWECESPYCNFLRSLCTEHGGRPTDA